MEVAIEEDEAEEAVASEGDSSAATPEQEAAYMTNSLVMFFCGVLVIAMQAGFALVEAGLNQAKNVVNILFKNLMDFSIGVLLYLLVGYGLMYPGDAYEGKWFGFGGTGFSGGLSFEAATEVDATSDYSPNADFIFQVAFAATAATIVSGAVAGRMKFGAYLVYSAVLTALIYPISGMWKWGGGVAAAEGFADFAGSIVVHAVGGFAGLAGAVVLGPRLGRYVNGKSIPMPGHNMTYATLGVFILLIGWYGFNPGSQLTYFGAANANITVYIAVTTTIAAAIGAIVAMLMSWGMWGKPDLSMALNGMLAGLVGITANCDQMSLASAIIVGAVAGALVVLGIVALDKLRIDDPVGAFPVHGLCGIWGGIATGILGESIPDGLDRMGYIMLQAKWSLIIAAWAFITMFALFAALKAIGMLRVSAAEEEEGLDFGEHGMHAYDYIASLPR
ncbi:MAG TPA: ammonium transporter [Lacipirellulaceae bacterium]|nr:ammonium transporter [Lacipirellulaceae bacterium]